MKLSGWGRYPVQECRVENVREPEALAGLFASADTVLARGNGRSYGDAALNPELTLSMLAMDRVMAFDAETGLLTCEAGMLLADILASFVPRGWFPPVVPGTKFVTVGGMIAADVHGKNHHRDGTFGAHVQSLSLMGADGEVRVCSRDSNADLFRATLGGMGLTGVILSASFRLQRIETAFVMAETLAVGGLEEAMTLFEASQDWPYSVAWVDCLTRGAKLGRGLVTRGKFMARDGLTTRLASNPLRPAPAGKLKVPVDAPSWLLGRASVGAFNGLYYRWGQARGGARPAHFNSFFFPLDRLGAWNRLYGRRGFLQYQCVLPKAESAIGIAALLKHIAAGDQGAFLGVLKLFGPAGEGLMSFPMEGYTLALDLPLRSGTKALVNALDAITHEYGGRVYLAKDACCTPERVRRGYPQRAAFEAIRADGVQGMGKFSSELSRRLKL